MSRFRFASVSALLFSLLLAPAAHAFFDPPWVTPSNPTASETVSVNIYGGICDIFLGREGYPKITQEGDEIRILLYGAHYPLGDKRCIYPTWTAIRTIGAFSPGNYTLTVDLLYDNYPFGFATLTIGTVPFTVAAPPASATSVPAIDVFAALALILTLTGAAWVMRRRAELLLIILVAAPLCVRAQSTQNIQVLLTTAPGAPTPAAVVAWSNASPRSSTPPLNAFTIKSPQRGGYLMTERASGDFLAWLNANPLSARRRLEDTLLLAFPSADVPAALAALRADPYVAVAAESPVYQSSSVSLVDASIAPEPEPLDGGAQYGWFDLNIDAAWALTGGGYALVGQVDKGLYVNHPALRQFSGSAYVGGNFIPAASKDVGLTGKPAQPGFDPKDVDEKKSMYVSSPSSVPACTSAPVLLPPAHLGHGTHVAGLLAANGASGLGVQGTCKHCGIAAYKTSYLECAPDLVPPEVILQFNGNANDRGQTETIDLGVQVQSLSFGIQQSISCVGFRYEPLCLALAYAVSREVPVVAASGNKRADLQFPASDKHVISAGGFQQNLALWDESPGGPTNCPPQPYTSECGSNYSKYSPQGYFTHQELLGSAKQVLSTAYPNTTWVDYAQCGDGYGTPMGDGLGLCTGTSMSTPQIAGVVGILRSINPLVPVGEPEPAAGTKPGLRAVLAQTASRAGAWDPRLGYGIPDAAAAARRLLGTVAGATVRNRATPLFRLYQATTKDFAETTSPQYALSLMINQDKNYVLRASNFGAQPVTVPGYAFSWDPIAPGEDPETGIYETTRPADPRAAIYVLTTDHRPRNEWPDLRPLHLMDKNAPGGKDYLLATTKAEIEAAHTAGYNLRTIQGYIYQPCTPEPTCIPPDAQKLWRQYKATDNDCATFLDSEKPAFEAADYKTACPTGATTMIGYAYPASDADGDGLPDGFEQVVGTNRDAADSDGDGIADATEFPLAGIATGDPCMGGTLGARNCGADRIFKDGFNS